jgi:hypothetical protein
VPSVGSSGDVVSVRYLDAWREERPFPLLIFARLGEHLLHPCMSFIPRRNCSNEQADNTKGSLPQLPAVSYCLYESTALSFFSLSLFPLSFRQAGSFPCDGRDPCSFSAGDVIKLEGTRLLLGPGWRLLDSEGRRERAFQGGRTGAPGSKTPGRGEEVVEAHI